MNSEYFKNYLRKNLKHQTYLRISKIARDFQKSFDYKYISSSLRINRLAGIHKGKRCFIIGNGPSLLDTNLELLRNEYTFGLNRIYLLFPKIGFQTTYLVAINHLVLEQFSDEIDKLKIYKFIRWSPKITVLFNSAIFIDIRKGKKFSKNAAKCLYGGSTVTYIAMQLAYFMGFQTVILVGVDHSFTTKGPAHQLIQSAGEDTNHFSPDYFGKGVKWNLPDLDGSERAYSIAKMTFEQDGRKIIDATKNGKLKIFPKIDYYSLF